jgi:hypothetical protein
MPGKLRAAVKGGPLPLSPYLKGSGSEELDRAQRRTYTGMANWAQGPECCASCSFWGYDQVVRDWAGNAISTHHRKACCGKYHELTGLHGAPIPSNAPCCRY